MLKINYLLTGFMEVNTLCLYKSNLLFDFSISVAPNPSFSLENLQQDKSFQITSCFLTISAALARSQCMNK